MAVRKELLRLVTEIIRRDNLGDDDIARMCGTSRARASTLLRGRLELFNSETLIDILARLGVDVEISVTRRRGYLRFHFHSPRKGWKPPPYLAP
jgi:predicted XRE-type DNA-binding protein